MSVSRAVALIDHHNASIQHVSGETSEIERIKEHRHYTRQHGSAVRSEHDFFSDLCDALAKTSETLIMGPHMALTDFRRYVEKHRPQLSQRLVGWESADHPSPAQALALARAFFVKHDRMAGRPGPSDN